MPSKKEKTWSGDWNSVNINNKFLGKIKTHFESHCKCKHIEKTDKKEIQFELIGILTQYEGEEAYNMCMDYLKQGDTRDIKVIFDNICNDCQFEAKGLEESLNVGKGEYTCPKCKSKVTWYYQIQKRSADEAMTSYITCCNKELLPKDKSLYAKIRRENKKKSKEWFLEEYKKQGGELRRCNYKWKS